MHGAPLLTVRMLACFVAGLLASPLGAPAAGSPEAIHEHGAPAAAYRLEVLTRPSPLRAEETGEMRPVIHGPGGPIPAAELAVSHERRMHLLLVSRNLEEFHHLHAEDNPPPTAAPGENDRVAVRLARGGEWLAVVDAVHRERALSLAVPFAVAGPAQEPTAWRFDSTRTVDGLTGTLEPPAGGVRAGSPARLAFRFTVGDSPATDLEPYLGAPAHVSSFAENAADPAHLHAAVEGSGDPHASHAGQGAAGSRLQVEHVFPRPGNHRLFVQVSRRGRVITMPFDLRVLSAGS